MGRRPAGTGPRRQVVTVHSGWKELTDNTTGDSYFWNETTGETCWEPPSEDTTPEDQCTSLQHSDGSQIELFLDKEEISRLETHHAGVAAAWEKLSVTTRIAHKIQLRTRMEDWRDGGLSSSFFARRVVEMASHSPLAGHGSDAFVGELNDAQEPSGDSLDSGAALNTHVEARQTPDTLPLTQGRESLLLFSATGEIFSTTALAGQFSSCGRRGVRTLGDNYYMVTFSSEDAAKSALMKVATIQGAVAIAEAGWVATHSGLYARYLQESDLEQSLFEVAVTEFEDTTVGVE